MMNRAPWTDIGRLQSEIQQVKNDVRNKADSSELSSVNRRMDSLERSMRELSTEVDGVLSELRQLREDRRLTQSPNPQMMKTKQGLSLSERYENETSERAYEFGGIPKRGYVAWL